MTNVIDKNKQRKVGKSEETEEYVSNEGTKNKRKNN